MNEVGYSSDSGIYQELLHYSFCFDMYAIDTNSKNQIMRENICTQLIALRNMI